MNSSMFHTQAILFWWTLMMNYETYLKVFCTTLLMQIPCYWSLRPFFFFFFPILSCIWKVKQAGPAKKSKICVLILKRTATSERTILTYYFLIYAYWNLIASLIMMYVSLLLGIKMILSPGGLNKSKQLRPYVMVSRIELLKDVI